MAPPTGQDKRNIARDLLFQAFSAEIQNLIVDPKRPVFSIILQNGLNLSIRYNDFEEYSYQLFYSQAPLDRILFDNYDDRWEVASKPHHFHPRGKKVAEKSPMNGDPRHDIPLLYPYIHP